MITPLTTKTKIFFYKMIDLLHWLFNGSMHSFKNETSIALKPKRQSKTNALIMKNFETSKISEFYNNMILALIKMFVYAYQFFEMIITTIYSFVMQKIIVIPETSINQAELHVENLNNIMKSLDVCLIKARKGHEQISKYLKNMKNLIEMQEVILENNLIEINNFKTNFNKDNLDSVQKNKIILDLEQKLEQIKQQLFNFENELTDITKQLKLQTSYESDEDYVFIINYIRDMKVKIQQQENSLRNSSESIDQQVEYLADRVSKSIISNANAESEDLEFEFNNISFVEDDSIQLELLKDDKRQFNSHERRFSDTLQQNSNTCVIDKDNKIFKNPIGSIEKVSSCQFKMIAKDTNTMEKEVQVSTNIKCIDAECQTIEINDSDLQKALDNYNSAKDQLNKTRKALDAYKLEKEDIEKSRDKIIDKLEKEIALLKTQINEKDSENAALTKELQIVNESKKENSRLKELEQQKKVAVVKEGSKIDRQYYGQNLAFLGRSVNKALDYSPLQEVLINEIKTLMSVSQHYKTIIQQCEEKIKIQGKNIESLRVNSNLLRNKYEALDRNFKNKNLEHSNDIKMKDETILYYKLTNQSQSNEIKRLKDELEGLRNSSRKSLPGNYRARFSWKGADKFQSYKRL